MWVVCRELKILPNDPLLKELSDGQISWIIANLLQDQEEMERAIDAKTPSGARVVYSALDE